MLIYEILKYSKVTQRDHEATYVVEKLSELRKRTFNLLDIGMPFLDFAVRRLGLAVPVRVHKL